MYKYFMGKRSNLKDRKDGVPIVIAIDEFTSKSLNTWLDKYLIDFDLFIERLKFVLKMEVVSINFEDQNNFICRLEDNRIIFLNLLHEVEPKCTIHVGNNEYVLCLKGDLIIEKRYEEDGKNRFGEDYSTYLREIFVGNSDVLISIKFIENHEGLYEKIKEHIDELDDWMNIKSSLTWLYSLNTRISSFILTLSGHGDKVIGLEKVEVENNQIVKYTILDEEDEYTIENDGSWKARHDELIIEYDAFERKRTIVVSPNQFQNLFFISDINKNIDILIKVIRELNELMRKIA